MKKYLSTAIALSLVLSALSFGGCGEKHTINTDIDIDGEHISGEAGVVYENVTDENGENVTDAEGETVTVAVTVPAKENSTSGDNTEKTGAETTAKAGKNEKTTKKSDAKNETTKKADAKNETTKKSASTDKKTETTTKAASGKKTDTTTKKAESSSKKPETTTKKPETTTKQTVPTTAPEVQIKKGDYEFQLRSDKKEVKAGDTFTVTLHLKNCDNVACFGLTMKSAGSVEVTNYKSNKFVKPAQSEDEDEESYVIYSNTDPEGVLFGGYIATSYDFKDDDLCTVTYKVSDTAKAGDTITFAAVPNQLLVSMDEAGNSTKDYSDAIALTPLVVTVK